MQIDRGRIMNDFIEPNKIQYSIPVYQRNYEWSKEQCEKLFEDIVSAHKKQKTHFCGSIVYSAINLNQKINTYIVIDGQQRMTTIYILLKALMDCTDIDTEKDNIAKALFNVDKFDSFAIDMSTKLKLKPVKSDNNQLLLLMDGKYDKMDKNSDVWKNYDLFKQLINTELNNGMTIPRIYDGLEFLMVARIRLEDGDQPQEIFERINSTGLPLSLSDKIRNFILMTDVEQERLYEDYWLEIENLIKVEQMNSFFLYYLYFKIDGFPKESEAYDAFKELYKRKKYTNENMLKELLHYANYYGAFLYGNSAYSKEVNMYLSGLRNLKQTTVFVFLFSVFDDYTNQVIDEKTLEKVLCFLQNYSIRRIVCEIGSNSLRGLYKTLYSRLFTNKKNKTYYYDSIVCFFKQLTSRDALPSDEEFMMALRESNLYRKSALCKPLLCAIENQGKELLVTENLSIEHIMPQNKNLSTAWQNMLGPNWHEVHDKYLHTLGNLTLTGYNSELGDKPFDEKKYKIEEVSSKVIVLYSDVKSTDVWDEKHIVDRANRLAKEVVKLFPIEDESTTVSFVDSRYHEYNCNEPNDAKGKTPNYYVFCGERVITTSYSEMLKSVVMKFYELNPAIIKRMAKNNETMGTWSSIILFSYDANQIKFSYMIPGTNIYQNTGFSSWYIIQFIKVLIEKFDLEYDDFVYSARDTKSAKENADADK